MFNSKLWETSGHWQNYKDDMFTLDVEKEKWALKPMNCPGHCLIFDSRDRSYKELPIRMAEFGIIHRNEASGALTGLTRVRRFVQDDTHVFCMPHQVCRSYTVYGSAEILNRLERKSMRCSTSCNIPMASSASNSPWSFQPGQKSSWVLLRLGMRRRRSASFPAIQSTDVTHAQQQLRNALDKRYSGKWDLNPGDGAFYGPKIDITIRDALRRSFQCATIQLDFQLPERFNLKYRSAEESINPDKPPSRPVIIHRAILGSLERFIAIITEHFAGKWYLLMGSRSHHVVDETFGRPFWLSPRQVLVIPVAVPYVCFWHIHRTLVKNESFCRESMHLKSPPSYRRVVFSPMSTTGRTHSPRRFGMARLHNITLSLVRPTKCAFQRCSRLNPPILPRRSRKHQLVTGAYSGGPRRVG
jgi:threonyl-tRNA synthetase